MENEYHLSDVPSRPLPSNHNAEKAIIGIILLDNDTIDLITGKLFPEDFYNLFCKAIYTSMQGLRQLGEPIDPIYIIEEMKRQSVSIGFQDVSRIMDLMNGIPRGLDITEYADIVIDKSLSRKIIHNCNHFISETWSEEKSAIEYLGDAQEQLFNLSQNLQYDAGFEPAGEIVTRSLERVQTVAQTGNPITGLSTGFTDLDSKTLGLQKTDLIIVAARPSMGKTALCLTLAQNAALRGNANVAVFSLEMGDLSLGDRILCAEADVDSMRFRSGILEPDEWQRLHDSAALIMNKRLSIDDSPGINTLQMRTRLRRLIHTTGRPLDLIMVDYLQLMTGIKRTENRQQEVSDISRELKQMAKEFDAPLIALSQLSRAPEQRGKNHRPMLSDLRESGSIEQDADVVAFIYREDYYLQPEMVFDENQVTAEITVAKQRNGPTGTIFLQFDKKRAKFNNLSNVIEATDF